VLAKTTSLARLGPQEVEAFLHCWLRAGAGRDKNAHMNYLPTLEEQRALLDAGDIV
jgi:hypothetical protein